MSIVHVNQIKSRLRSTYDGKVDLSDVSGRPVDEVDSHFLTRALAAYALEIEAELPPDEAAKALTDGFNDNGLDAVHISQRDRSIYLVQSKWIHDGAGEPDLGAIEKFIRGIEDLLSSRWERFNDRITGRKGEITQALNDPGWNVKAVIAYTGANKLSKHAGDRLEQLLGEINDTSEYLGLSTLVQKDLYGALVSGVSGKPIGIDISLRGWGKIEDPYIGYYGQVCASEIAKWWQDHRATLFAKNLRSVLGETEVNKEIRETLESAPSSFWYFNNGITVVADAITKTLAHGADTGYGTFRCENLSIVNGAQTVAAIGRFVESAKKSVADAYVPVRLISLERAPEGFGDAVTRTNNRQNRIEVRDFVSLDPQQLRIKTELAVEGIEYQLLRSEDFKSGPASFDLVEATTALVCATGDPDLAVQLKREISKLWEDTAKAPYTRLFNGGMSGPTVWNCVRVQRAIDAGLDAVRGKQAITKNQSILIWGNRLVASAVCDSLKPLSPSGRDLRFDVLLGDPIVSRLVEAAALALISNVGERYPNSYIATLFKNPTKSKDLHARTRAALSVHAGDVEKSLAAARASR